MKTICELQVASGEHNYLQKISTNTFHLVADEPEAVGGKNAGPTPYDYVLAGLGACTNITLQMYAERKKWALEGLRVELELLKDDDGSTRIIRTLHCDSELSDEQWQKLIEISGKTPVTKSLLGGSDIHTKHSGGE